MRKPLPTESLRRRGPHVAKKIIEAALEDLARVGFANLNVEEVAARAGVNKTTVYRRFQTKEALVREALGQVVGKMTDIPDTGAIRTDLIAFLEHVAALLRTARGQAILRVVSAEHDNPVFANLVDSLLPHTDTIIPRAAIKRAVARGELPRHTDPKLVLFTLVGALIHRVLFERGPMSSPYIEQLVDLVLFGAAGKPYVPK